uniref:Conserved oligomeric Golgi complex subunit 1 n=1 Tax=Ciona savignyi TaxID=51511 RepID=H2Z1D7_CIOSA
MEFVMTVFERNNVEEIRELEKKTRHEIELKKEELRQMVGERYRDLLEAADKITGMKKYSEIVTSTIKDIQEYKSKRTLSVPKLRASQLSVKNENRFLELAAETKVLMEMPEEIWLQVEAGNMITASFLYLQSLQVLKNLSLEGNHSYSPILQWIPVTNVSGGYSDLMTSSLPQLPLSHALRQLTHSVDQHEEKERDKQISSSLYSKLGALSSSWLSMSSSYTEN